MNSRERVIAAYNHKEPDKVPVCIGGTAQKFAKDIYYQIKTSLNIDEVLEEEKELDELGNIINYHPEVLDKLGSDFRHIHINRLPAVEKIPDGSWKHELGFLLKENEKSRIINIMTHPFSNSTVDEIDKYPWPDPYDERRYRGVGEQAKRLYEETDYAIGVYKATLLGIFDLCCVMRGMDKFLMDIMLDENLTETLINKSFEYNFKVYESLLKRVGKYVHVVEFNDDLGTQDNLFISPDIYRKYLKPRHRELVSMFKKHAPDAKIFFHCCGSVYDIIPDFIEIGIDILNPIQPYANKMNTRVLKEKFGNEIVFQGGIDLQKAMIGNLKDVEDEVKERIKTLAAGGGYVFATANNIGNDVPVENILKLYDLAYKYGAYPLCFD